eukprot:gene25747-31095_t
MDQLVADRALETNLGDENGSNADTQEESTQRCHSNAELIPREDDSLNELNDVQVVDSDEQADEDALLADVYGDYLNDHNASSLSLAREDSKLANFFETHADKIKGMHEKYDDQVGVGDSLEEVDERQENDENENDEVMGDARSLDDANADAIVNADADADDIKEDSDGVVEEDGDDQEVDIDQHDEEGDREGPQGELAEAEDQAEDQAEEVGEGEDQEGDGEEGDGLQEGEGDDAEGQEGEMDEGEGLLDELAKAEDPQDGTEEEGRIEGGEDLEDEMEEGQAEDAGEEVKMEVESEIPVETQGAILILDSGDQHVQSSPAQPVQVDDTHASVEESMLFKGLEGDIHAADADASAHTGPDIYANADADADADADGRGDSIVANGEETQQYNTTDVHDVIASGDQGGESLDQDQDKDSASYAGSSVGGDADSASLFPPRTASALLSSHSQHRRAQHKPPKSAPGGVSGSRPAAARRSVLEREVGACNMLPIHTELMHGDAFPRPLVVTLLIPQHTNSSPPSSPASPWNRPVPAHDAHRRMFFYKVVAQDMGSIAGGSGVLSALHASGAGNAGGSGECVMRLPDLLALREKFIEHFVRRELDKDRSQDKDNDGTRKSRKGTSRSRSSNSRPAPTPNTPNMSALSARDIRQIVCEGFAVDVPVWWSRHLKDFLRCFTYPQQAANATTPAVSSAQSGSPKTRDKSQDKSPSRRNHADHGLVFGVGLDRRKVKAHLTNYVDKHRWMKRAMQSSVHEADAGAADNADQGIWGGAEGVSVDMDSVMASMDGSEDAAGTNVENAGLSLSLEVVLEESQQDGMFVYEDTSLSPSASPAHTPSETPPTIPRHTLLPNIRVRTSYSPPSSPHTPTHAQTMTPTKRNVKVYKPPSPLNRSTYTAHSVTNSVRPHTTGHSRTHAHSPSRSNSPHTPQSRTSPHTPPRLRTPNLTSNSPPAHTRTSSPTPSQSLAHNTTPTHSPSLSLSERVFMEVQNTYYDSQALRLLEEVTRQEKEVKEINRQIYLAYQSSGKKQSSAGTRRKMRHSYDNISTDYEQVFQRGRVPSPEQYNDSRETKSASPSPSHSRASSRSPSPKHMLFLGTSAQPLQIETEEEVALPSLTPPASAGVGIEKRLKPATSPLAASSSTFSPLPRLPVSASPHSSSVLHDTIHANSSILSTSTHTPLILSRPLSPYDQATVALTGSAKYAAEIIKHARETLSKDTGFRERKPCNSELQLMFSPLAKRFTRAPDQKIKKTVEKILFS